MESNDCKLAGQEEAALRLYKSHKLVRAGMIVRVTNSSDVGGRVDLSLDTGITISVSGDWCRRHNPTVGGYFVSYADGYTSFSPAKAFQGGYAEVKAADAPAPDAQPQRSVHAAKPPLPGGVGPSSIDLSARGWNGAAELAHMLLCNGTVDPSIPTDQRPKWFELREAWLRDYSDSIRPKASRSGSTPWIK